MKKVRPFVLLKRITICSLALNIIMLASLISCKYEALHSSDFVSAPIEATIEEEPLAVLDQFLITAYCPCEKCCGIWSAQHPSRQGTGYIQKTATGVIPQEKHTIAADPAVVPFGTVLVIDDQEYVVEDTGAAIKGNRLDIFFESHEEALKWGKQYRIVYVKGDY